MAASSSIIPCFNCNKSSSDQLSNGWKLCTGGFAKLCGICYSVYKDGKFCEKFHSDEDGWRECEDCTRPIHCGCIVSLRDYSFDDFRGIICLKCIWAGFKLAGVTFRHMGLWLCGTCFKTHTLRTKCQHGNGSDFVPPPDCGDGIVRFVLYDLTKPQVASSSVQLDHVGGLVLNEHNGFTLPLLDSFLFKGLRTIKSLPPKCCLGFSRVLKGALDKMMCTPDDISCWLVREALAESFTLWSDNGKENLNLDEQKVKQCKRKICDGHYTIAVRVFSASGVVLYNDVTLKDLKAKHPFKPALSLPHIPIDHHQFIASPDVVLDMIKSFPSGTSCGRDGLRAQHLMDFLSGVAMDIFDDQAEWWYSSYSYGYCLEASCFQGEEEAILHVMNWLIEDRGDDLGLSMLLVDFKNAFNLVDRELDCIMGNIPYGHTKAWYLDDGTIIGDTLVEDPKSRLAGVFPPNIGQPGYGVKLLGGTVSVDFDYSTELVMKRLAKTIELMDDVAKINEPQCELLLLRSCAGILKLYFAMSTYSPRVFERSQRSFDAALHLLWSVLSLRLDLDFLLQSASLQTKMLRHSGIVASGRAFEDALCGLM
ncbi:hypothetical protein Tco_0788529 [Tanacetum coccineum]